MLCQRCRPLRPGDLVHGKPVELLDSSDLPPGWSRLRVPERQRLHRNSTISTSIVTRVTIQTPGRRFRSQKELDKYLMEHRENGHLQLHSQSKQAESARRESEERPYECQLCGKHYKTSIYLQQHMSLHCKSNKVRNNNVQSERSADRGKISSDQVSQLKEEFSKDTGLTEERCGALARELQLSAEKITKWFRKQGRKQLTECERRLRSREAGEAEIEGGVEFDVEHNQWRCLQCPFANNKEKIVKKHFDSQHCNNLYNCLDCQDSYQTIHSLDFHVKIRHKHKARSIVKDTTESDEEILSLMLFDPDQNQWKCRKCNFFHKTKLGLFSHVDSQHMNNLYVCQFCGKLCKTQATLRSHCGRNHKIEVTAQRKAKKLKVSKVIRDKDGK